MRGPFILNRVGNAALLICLLGGTAAWAGGSDHRAAAPSTRAAGASAASYLSPLELDPLGPVDPLEAFRIWRLANRTTLPAGPVVMQAHRAWEANASSASEAAGAAAGAPPAEASSIARGANQCVDGGLDEYQGEVAIAVNPLDPAQVVVMSNNDYRDPACQAPVGATYGTQAIFSSTDGGSHWDYQCAPWPAQASASVGPVMYGTDPTLAWDSRGAVYAAYLLVSQTADAKKMSSAIAVSKSTDAGASWFSYGIPADNLSTTALFEDKPMIAIDATSGGAHSHPGRLYLIWDENNIEMLAYTDDGASWRTMTLDTLGSSVGSDIAVGFDGTVYAAWDRVSTTGGPGKGDRLMFSASTDGGNSWAPPAQVASLSLASFGTNQDVPAQDKRGVNAFPAMAVDVAQDSLHRGTLYIVYDDFPAGSSAATDLNIYLIKSSNGGSTWSAPLQVNDDAGTATQFLPWVAADPANGAVAVSWYDTRNDPADKRTQIYVAVSNDGGSSFEPNVLVTQSSSAFANAGIAYSDENSVDNPSYNPNQYGDYAQLDLVGGVAWSAWTDSRQFYPADAFNPQREDIALATISAVHHQRPVSPP